MRVRRTVWGGERLHFEKWREGRKCRGRKFRKNFAADELKSGEQVTAVARVERAAVHDDVHLWRGEERRREGGIRGNRMERGKVPIVLFFEECEVGFGAKEQRMQEHSPFLRVP